MKKTFQVEVRKEGRRLAGATVFLFYSREKTTGPGLTNKAGRVSFDILITDAMEIFVNAKSFGRYYPQGGERIVIDL